MTDSEDGTFQEVNASRELNLGVPEEFPVDPVSSHITSKSPEEQAEAEARAKVKAEKDEEDGILTSALVITGVVVVTIGVAFIVTKRYKVS